MILMVQEYDLNDHKMDIQALGRLDIALNYLWTPVGSEVLTLNSERFSRP